MSTALPLHQPVLRVGVEVGRGGDLNTLFSRITLLPTHLPTSPGLPLHCAEENWSRVCVWGGTAMATRTIGGTETLKPTETLKH